MTEPFTALRKVDSARRCGLYYGGRPRPRHFALKDVDRQLVPLKGRKSIDAASVFQPDNIDVGSALLLESLNQPVTGHLLDIACGSGVIATVLATRNLATDPDTQ